MNASALLAQALDGPLIHGNVNEAAYPFSARSYLGDGSGLAWIIPEPLRAKGRFALDVEALRPVRPSVQRRFGIEDPQIFAEAWTRAEVCAKLLDIPIVVWLKQHGLSVDIADVGRTRSVEIALFTKLFVDEVGSNVVTFGAIAML